MLKCSLQSKTLVKRDKRIFFDCYGLKGGWQYGRNDSFNSSRQDKLFSNDKLEVGVGYVTLLFSWTGPRWKWAFWLAPWAVRIFLYGPLRWTASVNCLVVSVAVLTTQSRNCFQLTLYGRNCRFKSWCRSFTPRALTKERKQALKTTNSTKKSKKIPSTRPQSTAIHWVTAGQRYYKKEKIWP